MGNALVVDVVARIAEVLRSEWDLDRLLSVTEVDLFPHGYAGLRPFPQAVESRTQNMVPTVADALRDLSMALDRLANTLDKASPNLLVP